MEKVFRIERVKRNDGYDIYIPNVDTPIKLDCDTEQEAIDKISSMRGEFTITPIYINR